MKFFYVNSPKEAFVSVEDNLPVGATEIVANSVEAAFEKHIPVVTRNGDSVHVEVGSVEHPMLDVHYIAFIALVNGNNVMIKRLLPGDKPVADFIYRGKPEEAEVYAFCNLHGLWVAKVQ